MAGIQDKYPNLPGHLTEYKDGGLQLVQDVNPPKTESMLILGTSIDGPIMEPVTVDANTFEVVFGKATDERGIPNGSTVGQAFEEAYAGGCRDIRIMRISGTPATADVMCSENTITKETIYEKILGVASGNAYNNSKNKLSKLAKEILELKINGSVASASDYELIEEEATGVYIDNAGVKHDETTLVELEYIMDGTKKVVITKVTDAIYKNDTKVEYKTASQLGNKTTGYSVVVAVNQYVKANAKDIATSLLAKQPLASEIKKGKGLNDTILEKAVVSVVAIKDNVCDAGAFIDVKYIDKNTGDTVSENSSQSGAFMANGSPISFDIEAEVTPYPSMTKVYFNGVEYIEADVTVEDSSTKIFEVVTVGDVTSIKINPGAHAKRGSKIEVRFPYKKSVKYEGALKLETAFGGSIYNNTQYLLETRYYANSSGTEPMKEQILKITKPRSKRSQENEEPLTYSSFDYPTLALMARAINNDYDNAGFIKAYVKEEHSNTPTSLLIGEAVAKSFEGGDDGVNLTKQELFVKLSGSKDSQGCLLEQGAYQLLENYTVDYIVPTGVYADDKLAGKFEDFAYELALFCAVVSHRNHTTMGVISTTSPSEPTLKSIEEHVEKLEGYDNSYLMRDAKGDIIKDTDGNTIDLGMYISVLAGGDVVMNNSRLGQYATNSASAFVGFISTLAVNTAPTNKVVPYAQGLRIKYSNGQLDRLTGKRYITFKYKGNGSSVAIVDAMTSALSGSDYERVSSMRAVRELANDTREVADPFLGEPNKAEQRNALASLLDKRYDKHKEAGTIKDYSFQIICTPYDELVGAAKIMLTIVPAQELRRITTVIALKPSI